MQPRGYLVPQSPPHHHHHHHGLARHEVTLLRSTVLLVRRRLVPTPTYIILHCRSTSSERRRHARDCCGVQQITALAAAVGQAPGCQTNVVPVGHGVHPVVPEKLLRQ